MSSADTRTRAMAAVMHNGLCTLRGSGCVNGAASAVDALLAAGWRPPADDAAVERAALAAAADDLEEAAVLLADWAGYAPEWARSRHNFDADLATVKAAAAKARAALAAAEEGEA